MNTNKTIIYFMMILATTNFISCKGNHAKDDKGTPSKKIEISDKPVKFKFFLERSGSMTAYDSRQSNGEFKLAISKVLNNVANGESNMVYIVNDAVYPFDKSFKEFLSCADIFDATKGTGDPSYTDFSCIFDSILCHTKKGEASILVSDLVYSTADMTLVNPQKIMNEAKSTTTTVFKGHSDKDVVVVKMIADYQGKYYPFNSTNSGIHYSGNRPYYFLIVADQETLRSIFLGKRYKDFANLKALPGFENYYCFSHYADVPAYSVLLSDKRNRGKLAAEKGQAKEIRNIENVKSDRDGRTSITIAVDLSGVITSQEYKNDPKNYKVESISSFKVSEVLPLTAALRTTTIEKHAPTATHLVVISTTEKVLKETVTLHLKNTMPKWISETNSNDDTNLNDKNFSTTTFAFQYLMEGIYEAFFSSTEIPDFVKFDININK